MAEEKQRIHFNQVPKTGETNYWTIWFPVDRSVFINCSWRILNIVFYSSYFGNL